MAVDRIQPTDAILYNQSLTEEDRNVMIELVSKNRLTPTSNLFDEIREEEALEKMDFAIKAILDHIIKKREEGENNGNT